MILLPIAVTLGLLVALSTELRAGEPDSYTLWLQEPDDDLV